MSRVEWHDREYSGKDGRVNGMPLFTLSRGLTRTEDKPWVLRTRLHGFVDQRVASPEAADVLANRILDRFIEKLGAEWAGSWNKKGAEK